MGDSTAEGVRVTVGKAGQGTFTYDPAAQDAAAIQKQDKILVALIDAWQQWGKVDEKTRKLIAVNVKRGDVTVDISLTFPTEAAKTAHEASLSYPVKLAKAVATGSRAAKRGRWNSAIARPWSSS